MEISQGDREDREKAREEILSLIQKEAGEKEKTISAANESDKNTKPAKLSSDELMAARMEARKELSGANKSNISEESPIKNTKKLRKPATIGLDQSIKNINDSKIPNTNKGRAIPTQGIPYNRIEKIVKPNIPVRTLQNDIRGAVEKDNMSLAQIAIAEQERGRTAEQGHYLSQKRKKQFILLALSIIFAVSGAGVISYFAFIKVEPVPKPRGEPEFKSLINADEQIVIPLTVASKTDLIAEIHSSLKSSDLKDRDIANIVLVKKVLGINKDIGVQDFLKVLDTNMPSSVLRSLRETFMLGGYSRGGEIQTFIILKPISYENVFSGFFNWENSMVDDLSSLIYGPSAIKPPLGKWKDVEIRNIPARSYRIENEVDYLLYSFLDKETTLIASDIQTFIDIVSRVNTPKEVLQ